jgi:hypothetical protein
MHFWVVPANAMCPSKCTRIANWALFSALLERVFGGVVQLGGENMWGGR